MEQQNIEFPEKLSWGPVPVEFGSNDQYAEKNTATVKFKNGAWFIDEKEAPFEKIKYLMQGPQYHEALKRSDVFRKLVEREGEII